MDLVTLGAILGSVTGIISLASIIYFAGFKLGKMTTQIDTIAQDITTLKEGHQKIGKMATQLDLLWEIYARIPLMKSVDSSNVGVGSKKYVLTEKGKALLPEDLKEDLRKVALKLGKIEFKDAAFIIKEIGIDRLTDIALDKKIGLDELITFITLYSMEILEKSRD
ncbi:MAG: hypothetical protein ACE5J9_04770 [Methanosarcinales archaeon]